MDVEEHLEKAVSITELLYGQGVSDAKVSLVQYAKQFIGNPYGAVRALQAVQTVPVLQMSVFSEIGVSVCLTTLHPRHRWVRR